MFYFDPQLDGSYIVYLLDNSQLKVTTKDTLHLRTELAKLCLRIEAREFVIHHQYYKEGWWNNVDNLSSSDIEKLSEVYSHIFPSKEEWILLSSYTDTTDESIANLEREVLEHKNSIDALKKELDEKKGNIKNNLS